MFKKTSLSTFKTQIKHFIKTLAVALSIIITVCSCQNSTNSDLKKPTEPSIKRTKYDADYSYCYPQYEIPSDVADVNEAARALLSNLGLEERFISFLSDQTLSEYSTSDVLRVVLGEFNADDGKNVLMRMTMCDTGASFLISIDIELKGMPKERFSDVVGLTTEVQIISNEESFKGWVQHEGGDIIPLQANKEFEIVRLSYAQGFILDLNEIAKSIGEKSEKLRFHFEYSAQYLYPDDSVNYNAYLCYEHLLTKHDGKTKIGLHMDSGEFCYLTDKNSEMSTERHLIVTPEFLVFDPKG